MLLVTQIRGCSGGRSNGTLLLALHMFAFPTQEITMWLTHPYRTSLMDAVQRQIHPGTSSMNSLPLLLPPFGRDRRRGE